jgi:hypothetical protein
MHLNNAYRAIVQRPRPDSTSRRYQRSLPKSTPRSRAKPKTRARRNGVSAGAKPALKAAADKLIP